MQAARRKLEADPAACDRLAWTEHCAAGLMAEALAAQPPATKPVEHASHSLQEQQFSPPPPAGLGREADQGRGEGFPAREVGEMRAIASHKSSPPPLGAEGRGEVGETASLLARTNPSSFPLPQGEGEAPTGPVGGESVADPLAEAEAYAAIYPERAALIRRLGRLPGDVSFGPPDDDLVQALIAARTPALAALDRAFVEARAA
jgi:hypothetical protein